MSVSVDLRDFERAFGDLEAGLRNGAHQALVSAVKAAFTSAKTTTLFKDGPDAKLRDSITMGTPDPLGGFIRAGGRGAGYAVFVEAGTKAHEIRAKNGGSLRFVVAGRTMFRKVVRHPGTQARPFMGRAADVGEQTLDYGLEFFSERPIARFNEG